VRTAIAFVSLAACGGDPAPAVDAPTASDGQSQSLCLVEENYGDVGTLTGSQSLGLTTTTIVLDMGPPRDSFFMRLANMGVFSGGLMNGTFTIDGAELSSTTCGLCVNLLADIGNMGPQKFFFATGGTVTLTSTSPPRGSLANVTMQEVTSGGAPIAGGCVTAIDAMTFQ
jgi:hypothetical protein